MAGFERFGEYLVSRELVSRDALTGLLATQRLVKERIGLLAVREGLITDDQLAEALSGHLGIPLMGEMVTNIERGVVEAIPKKMALKAEVLPVGTGEKGELLLACSGPVPKGVLQNMSRLARRQIRLVLTTPKKLKKMQNLFFSRDYDTSIKINTAVAVEDIGFGIEIVEKILLRAVNQGASDIHVEPGKEALIVRFRVDGVMFKTETLPFDLASKIISRIKVLSSLDIAEKRKPQDGSFAFAPRTLNVDIDPVNIRVSILPVIHGEKAVLRILPPHDEAVDLAGIGMKKDLYERFVESLQLPHGIVLVTGPTGSGKSTTLYGALKLLRSDTINITTLEDPVELTMQGINQTHISGSEKISFADGLRSILRQDPDVIMVGEIRDAETLNVSLRAAITGHMVLSTLHTNDAPSAFSRLQDMGAEPFLVAASVRAVLAQRLVRRVCPACRETVEISRLEKEMLGLPLDETFTFNRGRGCPECAHRGYRGRCGLFELFFMEDEIKEMVVEGRSFGELAEYATEHLGFTTLRQDGIEKIRQGITTPEEVMRVTME
ncbi:type II/IV secretion system protein [Desulfoluna sp.]|uniref:GspE/PulE family protein n=1 Tax=Desulfoluna sp. TaxID=2045199 RepID=UPI00262597B9|nr:type II/IV secretion system protein [Desulfoluna sp.]